jgi:hypothetical protein
MVGQFYWQDICNTFHPVEKALKSHISGKYVEFTDINHPSPLLQRRKRVLTSYRNFLIFLFSINNRQQPQTPMQTNIKVKIHYTIFQEECLPLHRHQKSKTAIVLLSEVK